MVNTVGKAFLQDMLLWRNKKKKKSILLDYEQHLIKSYTVFTIDQFGWWICLMKHQPVFVVFCHRNGEKGQKCYILADVRKREKQR